MPSRNWSQWRHLSRLVYWTGYVLIGWLATLWLAWLLLARLDFLYPVWYEVLDIDRHVAVYGPQNRYRSGFEHTSKQERIRLFSEIVEAIHHGGNGLKQLTYHNRAGQPWAILLTPPEILHLQDVANLLGSAQWAGWLSLAAWLLWSGCLLRYQQAPPAIGRLFLALFLILGCIGIVALLVGPVRIFYALHEWVFPPGHPWFFYYQDSLLTTLLKAPELFGYIAVSWVSLGCLLLLLSTMALRRLAQRHSRSSISKRARVTKGRRSTPRSAARRHTRL